MDLSFDYIKMCLAAKEIQLMRSKHFEDGDFFYTGAQMDGKNASIPLCDVAVHDSEGTNKPREYYEVWLPRIDQLVELIHEKAKNTTKADIIWTMRSSLTEFAYNKKDTQDTIEKALLIEFMSFCHKKVWNEKEEKWHEKDSSFK